MGEVEALLQFGLVFGLVWLMLKALCRMMGWRL